MAKSQTYYCPACNYKTITSAGPSSTFSAKFNTFVCLKCKEVKDIATHFIHREPAKKDPNEPEPLLLMSSGKSTIKEVNQIMCNRCQGLDLKLWDTVEKPCPKCSTPLERDRGWLVILAD